jgi:hypothetical protein
MSISFNFDEVYGLTADLTAAPQVLNQKVRQAIQQSGIRTKESWAKDARRGTGGAQYAPTIDYEASESGADGEGAYTVDIGPNLKRYGGKTGVGGLVPSFGIFDDPLSSAGIATPPSRARPRAEKFGGEDLVKGISIAVDQSLKERGL